MGENKNTLEIGEIVSGKVVKITDFGVFLELSDGQNGMVHISEISHTFVKDVREFLSEDQVVEAKVIEVKDNGRIALSIKQVQEQPQESRPKPRRSHDPNFEKMLKSYMKSSEERLSDIKRNRMAKRM